ncbi:uncharacterized protein METZ01_LOCUS253835, partial [marine metagenome]
RDRLALLVGIFKSLRRHRLGEVGKFDCGEFSPSSSSHDLVLSLVEL